MSNLLTQLTQLQSKLANVGEKYRQAQTELHHLKTRPLVDKVELEEANEQLSLVFEHNNTLEQQIQQHEQAYQSLEKRFNELAEAYQIKELELSKANKTIHKLIEKNRVASESVQALLTKLREIDTDNED